MPTALPQPLRNTRVLSLTLNLPGPAALLRCAMFRRAASLLAGIRRLEADRQARGGAPDAEPLVGSPLQHFRQLMSAAIAAIPACPGAAELRQLVRLVPVLGGLLVRVTAANMLDVEKETDRQYIIAAPYAEEFRSSTMGRNVTLTVAGAF